MTGTVRLGVISDVHANLPALRAVLSRLEGHVDEIVCCGDVVGYGPDPNECVATLETAGLKCVAGNHDLMAVGRLDLPARGSLARVTLDWTRSVLGDGARAYLEGLPELRDAPGGVVLTHGSIADPTEYVRDPPSATRQLILLAERHPIATTLLLGHTHRPFAFTLGDGMIVPRRAGERVVRGTDRRWVLNPGSVGQSRERRPVARYAILDCDRGEASFHAFSYDHRATARALRRHGLPPHAHHVRPRPVARRLVALRDRVCERWRSGRTPTGA